MEVNASPVKRKKTPSTKSSSNKSSKKSKNNDDKPFKKPKLSKSSSTSNTKTSSEVVDSQSRQQEENEVQAQEENSQLTQVAEEDDEQDSQLTQIAEELERVPIIEPLSVNTKDNKSCHHCRLAHTGCDKRRPCANCVRKGKTCVDYVKPSQTETVVNETHEKHREIHVMEPMLIDDNDDTQDPSSGQQNSQMNNDADDGSDNNDRMIHFDRNIVTRPTPAIIMSHQLSYFIESSVQFLGQFVKQYDSSRDNDMETNGGSRDSTHTFSMNMLTERLSFSFHDFEFHCTLLAKHIGQSLMNCDAYSSPQNHKVIFEYAQTLSKTIGLINRWHCRPGHEERRNGTRNHFQTKNGTMQEQMERLTRDIRSHFSQLLMTQQLSSVIRSTLEQRQANLTIRTSLEQLNRVQLVTTQLITLVNCAPFLIDCSNWSTQLIQLLKSELLDRNGHSVSQHSPTSTSLSELWYHVLQLLHVLLKRELSIVQKVGDFLSHDTNPGVGLSRFVQLCEQYFGHPNTNSHESGVSDPSYLLICEYMKQMYHDLLRHANVTHPISE